MICSRCGKELNDILIELNQQIRVFKITEDNLYIPTANMSEPTHEFLCKDCFYKYCDCLDRLNDEYQKTANNADMVKVVDEVQYENPNKNICEKE